MAIGEFDFDEVGLEEDMDLYNEQWLEEDEDEDRITSGERGFMRGYLSAA